MASWAKAPFAIGSVACAACLAVTATMASAPLAQQAGEQIAKTIHRGATLAANPITQLDAFSALGNFFGTDAFSALGTGILGTDAFGAIPVLQNFVASGGDLTILEPNADGSGGYAALSGLNSYATGNIAGIDAFSSLGATKLSDIDAFSALPNWDNFFRDGDLSRATGLSGIDAFSALPVYNALLQGNIAALAPSPNPVPGGDPVGGIAAFSAVPGFFGIDPPPVAPDFPPTGTPSPLFAAAKETPKVDSTTTEVPSGGSNLVKSFVADPPPVSLPAVPPVPDVTPAAPQAKIKDNGGATQNLERNSLNFTPKSIDGKPFLFGSGGGVDNGMPGWQKGLKSLGIGGDTGGTAGGTTGSTG